MSLTQSNTSNIMLLRILLLAVVACTASMVHGQDGKSLYNTCSACHGANGEGNAAMHAPALAGQSASYIARQLDHFKRGVRGNDVGDPYGPQMKAMAALLPDQAAIDAVAQYAAAMPRTSPAATIEGDVNAGYKQYNMKCGACHSADAKGNEGLSAPALVGVGDAYLLRQMTHFRSGQRGTDASDKYGRQMRMMANTVTDQEITDLLSYLNSLK